MIDGLSRQCGTSGRPVWITAHEGFVLLCLISFLMRGSLLNLPMMPCQVGVLGVVCFSILLT